MDYTGRIITKNPQTPSANGAPGVWTLDEAMQYSKQGKWPPGYQISRSVRLRSSASAYFNRTLTTPTNNKIWTFSCWFKRGQLTYGASGVSGALFYAPSSGSTFAGIYFTPTDIINWYDASGGAGVYLLQTTQVFRDPSAWYHLVCAYDSTQATASDRQKMYINGSLITALATTSYVAQNTNGRFNSAVAHDIGKASAAGPYYFDGQMTEINFIDGQALTPASFGYFDTYTGVWQPAPYTGTYGNNGFYLNFKDPTSTTTIGYDYSGNSNNWTANNISVTAGTTYDSMVDVPINWGTDTGVGGEVRGNYCTFNPVYIVSGNSNSGSTWSNGNLQFSSGTNNVSSMPTMALPTTGKWYWEIIVTAFGSGSSPGIGICDYTGLASGSGGWWYRSNGNKYDQSANGFSYGATWTTNDVIGVAVDMDAATLTFYKNGVSQGVAWTSITSNVSGTLLYPFVRLNVTGDNFIGNFGQRAFSYTAPSGYKALCTQNISVPTVLNGASYMAATLYSGTGGTLTISNGANNTIGTTFQPDWVWVKSRSAATDHKLTDSVRGATKALISDTTGAETTDTNGVTAFGTTGFTLGSDTVYNNSGATYIGWQWKASGSTVSNTTGSITSTVSTNTTAGFSILTYTGNGTVGATVGHGLGVTPGMVIVKSRSAAADWPVKILPYMTGGQRLELSTTNAITTEAAGSGSLWNATNPNSTVITLGNQAMTNANGTTYVAYCFAPITGYSAFGSWQNNNSTDGAFIYLGFRPRFILLKNSDNVERWFIWDSSRQPYNMAPPSNNWLVPNSSAAEGANGANTAEIDGLSNGFKIRTTDPSSGEISFGTRTYIYAAFAENPFTIARAR